MARAAATALTISPVSTASQVIIMFGMLAPGVYVRNPACPDWGLGMVQSVVGQRITVSFEHAGKLVINAAHVALEPCDPDAEPPADVPPRRDPPAY